MSGSIDENTNIGICLEGGTQGSDIFCQIEHHLIGVALNLGPGEEIDFVQVRAGCNQPRDAGIPQAIFGCEDDGFALQCAALATGELFADAMSRDDIDQNGGFA